ncbi:response regulator transcription factor [Fundicoccus ignavus]|uniref:Response regulator n=1 Tax=Fundicoccus ignavus TaxID=2664442 RepID=A0A6I2GL22_9LACT|nr:response regulator transcription factor [Fundicoccus ignavus]MRI86251.1 response regulator [Fundicoccus ignavus]MRJ46263.1 response regulator [Fundicoccus ignavus]
MRILLIDDDALVTSGIQTIIEKSTQDSDQPIKVCAIGRNGNEALLLYEIHQPDIILMDIRMPELDGITAGKQLLERHPDARVIYLTTFLEDEYIVDALRLGAKGYLMKTDFASLIPAFEAVINGQRVFGDEIVAKIPTYLDSTQANTSAILPELSQTEQQLVYWVAEGLNNKEIAEAMHFSEGTIRNYLSTILEKLDLRDRTQLAIHYFKNLH